jgi:hypothetical protein
MCEIQSHNLHFIASINKYEALKKSSKSSNKLSNKKHQIKIHNASSQSLIEHFEAFFYLLDSLSKRLKCQNMFEQIKSKLQRDSNIKGLLAVFLK